MDAAKTLARLHFSDGAPGRTRTNTSVRKPDFESGASTNSATGARSGAAQIKPIDGGQVNARGASSLPYASIIIHQLAHYCGGSNRNLDSIEHRASPFPHPNGRHLEDGFRDYGHMTPDVAFRNAQSYQAFCEPNRIGMSPK